MGICLRNSLPLALRRWEGFACGTSQKTYLLRFTRFVTCRTTGQVKTNFIRHKFLFIIHRGDGWQIRPMLALWQKEVLS
jgi:hypothetical protein